MTSFLELPRLAFDGRDVPSIYVNTEDIVTLVAHEYLEETKVEVRGLGAEGMTATIVTYAPLGAILNLLGELAKFPGVRSWADDTKQGWREPLAAKLRYQADQERAQRASPY